MPEVRLSVGSMQCRHCVREVTGWLRDVVGVETIMADAKTGTVVLGGTMTVADVLAVFAGSDYTARVVDAAPPTAT
jgi:copper chaperone CopZ